MWYTINIFDLKGILVLRKLRKSFSIFQFEDWYTCFFLRRKLACNRCFKGIREFPSWIFQDSNYNAKFRFPQKCWIVYFWITWWCNKAINCYEHKMNWNNLRVNLTEFSREKRQLLTAILAQKTPEIDWIKAKFAHLTLSISLKPKY